METTEFLDPVVDFPLDIDLALSELFQNDSEDDPQDEPPAEADGRRPSIESTGSVAPVSQDGYIFKSWMRSVRSNRTHVLKPRRVVMSWPDENTEEGCLIFARNEPETLPDTVSDTSSAPVKNMETASFSQATLSVAGRARTNTVTSTKYSTSVFSNSEAARASIDSNRLTTSVSLDEAAWNRAVQRRQILQELVGTETVYVSGLRALGEVFSTTITSQTGIGRSVGTLLRLHSTFLDALRIAVPRVPTATFAASMKWMVGKKASKQSSTDCHRKSVTSRRMREPVEHRIRSRRNIAAEPNEAQKVAEILMSKLPKFKIYEEYGVKYHLVSQEIEELRKTVDFQMWDNGTEALSRSLAPRECQELSPNQALTIGDLLAKPIQRVCKYQLFLSDLLKCTPSSDCPAAHEALEMVHQCMIDTVQEINRATGDPVAKDRMAKTILLRNRLDFTGFGRDRDILREFGPIKACGVLHITYEATESIAGEYMACALFASHIILAVPRTETRKFGVLAVIATTRAKVENVNEKPGLQCTRTPHSWKFLYLASGETYELVMTACSTREADQWKDHLLQNISPEITVDTPRIGTKVMFPIKRRPVVTINEAGNMVQPICRLVRIKGTEAIPRLNQTPSMSPSRPQTLLVTPMETLAPNRQTRIRMERWLSDMWTCDIIPYPGMPGRGELFIRSQAGSFFRSLSSRRPFSRRASSIASATTQSIKSHSRAEETDTTTPTSPISNHSTRELDETIDAHPLRSSSPDYTALPQIKCADEMVQHEAPGTSAKYVKEGTKTGKRTRWGVSIFTTPGRSRRTRPVEV